MHGVYILNMNKNFLAFSRFTTLNAPAAAALWTVAAIIDAAVSKGKYPE